MNYSLADATILPSSTEVAAVLRKALAHGFIEAEQMPSAVDDALPAGTVYTGKVAGKDAVLFLGDEDQFVVAVRTDQAAMGPNRKQYVQEVRDTLGLAPEDLGTITPQLSTYVMWLAKWIRGEVV